MQKKISIIIIFVLALFLSGCHRKARQIEETTTSGNIRISVDESYYLMTEAEKTAFESFYPYAKINVTYRTEYDVFNDFMNDSVRLIIVNKELPDNQVKYLRSKQIIVRTTKIALDAIAFIINKENYDSNIRFDQFKDIFTGKLNDWKQVNPVQPAGKIVVVFDNEKSCNVRYLKEKFNTGTKFPSNCFAVKNNSEVINYVEKNTNAIGVISVNWISDKFDSVSKGFLKQIRVVEAGDINNVDGNGNFCKPYAGYIADGSYPFIRDVYIISRETFSGLGTGFASFIAGDKGQRIVLKDGLIPATMPVRLVEIKN